MHGLRNMLIPKVFTKLHRQLNIIMGFKRRKKKKKSFLLWFKNSKVCQTFFLSNLISHTSWKFLVYKFSPKLLILYIFFQRCIRVIFSEVQVCSMYYINLIYIEYIMNILGIYYLHKNGGKRVGLSYTVLSYILKEKELRLETSMAHLMMGEISRHGKI